MRAAEPGLAEPHCSSGITGSTQEFLAVPVYFINTIRLLSNFFYQLNACYKSVFITMVQSHKEAAHASKPWSYYPPFTSISI
ncbi:hypothetical protein FKM82_022091 [Ascaphus truei]